MPKPLISISAALVSVALVAVTTLPSLARSNSDLAEVASKPAVIRKQIVQEKLEIKKENIENKIDLLKEKQASRTAIFKAKTDAFKDKLKASAAARINTNLNMINQKQTAQLQKNLSTMSGILDKLETRVNTNSPDIKNPASASAAIASARVTIASASAAVTAQAQKDYTIQITSESKIKGDAKLQRDKLHTDLLAVRKLVIDAKQTVASAISTARVGPASEPVKIEKKEGSASGRE